MMVLVGVVISASAGEFAPSMVLIDQAGNADDNAPAYGYVKEPMGGVAYNYYLSKTEVTVTNFVNYLNAAAGVGDVNGLYTPDMAYSLSGPQQIAQVGDTYVANAGWENRPAAYISYLGAARYCNYLTSGDTEVGVYTFRDPSDPAYILGPIINEAVKTGSTPAYWIPTIDELYKGHFYNANTGTYEQFATGSSVVPGNVPDGTGNNANYKAGTGVEAIGSPYHLTEVGAYGENSWGLSDTGGNVQEWTQEYVWGQWIPQADGTTAHYYGPLYHGGSFYSSSAPFMDSDYWTGYNGGGEKSTWQTHGWFDNGLRIASNMADEVVTLLEGDANRDGVVSAGDYAAVQANFGSTGEPGILGDANGDGVVSAGDYASVQANFGNTAGGAVVPEPTTLTLLGLGIAAMIRRRKK